MTVIPVCQIDFNFAINNAGIFVPCQTVSLFDSLINIKRIPGIFEMFQHLQMEIWSNLVCKNRFFSAIQQIIENIYHHDFHNILSIKLFVQITEEFGLLEYDYPRLLVRVFSGGVRYPLSPLYFSFSLLFNQYICIIISLTHGEKSYH